MAWPEVGDRFKLREGDALVWQVHQIGLRSEMELGGKRERAALLRPAAGGGPKRIVSTERLMSHYVELGNFAIPAGYRVQESKMFGQGYVVVTAAGNVHGAPAGSTWTEREAIDVAKRLAAEDAARFKRRARAS